MMEKIVRNLWVSNETAVEKLSALILESVGTPCLQA